MDIPEEPGPEFVGHNEIYLAAKVVVDAAMVWVVDQNPNLRSAKFESVIYPYTGDDFTIAKPSDVGNTGYDVTWKLDGVFVTVNTEDELSDEVRAKLRIDLESLKEVAPEKVVILQKIDGDDEEVVVRKKTND